MANIENIKVGNTTYGITDANSLPLLTEAQKETLLLNGTYLGEPVSDGKVFTLENSGNIVKYQNTIVPTPLTFSTGSIPQADTWFRVVYGNGVYVAIPGGYGSYAGSDKFMYSTDGVTWNLTTVPYSRIWYGVVYGNGMFVAVSRASDTSVYSTDGIHWTASTLPYSDLNLNWYDVAYGDGKFVVTATGSNLGAYSTDGHTWSTFNMPSNTWWRDLKYINNRFIVVTQKDNLCAISVTGTSGWTTYSMPQGAWFRLTYGNGKYVAVQNAAGQAAYSTDGTVWSTSTTTLDAGCRALSFDGKRFIAAGDGVVYYSEDGDTWTKDTTNIGDFSCSDILYHDNKVILIPWVDTETTFKYATTPYDPVGALTTLNVTINDYAISSVKQTWSANKIVTVFNSYDSSKQDLLTELPGYDETATQSIKNINGVLQWVTDSTT